MIDDVGFALGFDCVFEKFSGVRSVFPDVLKVKLTLFEDVNVKGFNLSFLVFAGFELLL